LSALVSAALAGAQVQPGHIVLVVGRLAVVPALVKAGATVWVTARARWDLCNPKVGVALAM